VLCVHQKEVVAKGALGIIVGKNIFSIGKILDGKKNLMEGKTAAHSREAAKEYSPRRKPWVNSRKKNKPEGAKENFRTQTRGSNAPGN